MTRGSPATSTHWWHRSPRRSWRSRGGARRCCAGRSTSCTRRARRSVSATAPPKVAAKPPSRTPRSRRCAGACRSARRGAHRPSRRCWRCTGTRWSWPASRSTRRWHGCAASPIRCAASRWPWRCPRARCRAPRSRRWWPTPSRRRTCPAATCWRATCCRGWPSATRSTHRRWRCWLRRSAASSTSSATRRTGCSSRAPSSRASTRCSRRSPGSTHPTSIRQRWATCCTRCSRWSRPRSTRPR